MSKPYIGPNSIRYLWSLLIGRIPTTLSELGGTINASRISGLEPIATDSDSSNVTYYTLDGFTKTLEEVIDETYETLDLKAPADHTHSYGSITDKPEIVTSISESSTDNQIPSAKAIYDCIGDTNTIISQINLLIGGDSV